MRHRTASVFAGAGKASSLFRDAGITVDAPQSYAGTMGIRWLAGAEITGKDVPHRASTLLVDRSPARYLVAFAGLDRMAIFEPEVGNPASDGFRRRAAIGETADPDHIAALLIIGIGVEQIVADVFEGVLDLTAGQILDVGFAVADRGLGQHVFHR